MEPVDLFKKLRDVSDDIVKVLEGEGADDEKELERVLGRFFILMMEIEGLK
ncbi:MULTISPECIES: hypothetical protein [Bacillus]|uniref:hypothetical protein n=1 Tax=Bacillus TaxID=1386 RepID=UPI001CC49104|nr:hypothetical protein [Bacillus paralicheniformis]MBZ5212968.1 hypothetical protein [Bacillus paralicheniformis]